MDDDPDVLRGLERMLRKRRGSWEMTFVLGARAGVEEIERTTFDVVVSDMRMPDFNGFELLAQVRDPATIRMVLSGYHERRPVSHVATVVHVFLDKPCFSEILTVAVERACAVRARFVDEPMQALIGRIAAAPPHVVDAAIAELLEQDPVLSGRILALAHEASVELETPATISNVVARIGLDRVAIYAFAALASDRGAASDATCACLIRNIIKTMIAIAGPEHDSTAAARQLDLAAYLLTRWGLSLETIEALTQSIHA